MTIKRILFGIIISIMFVSIHSILSHNIKGKPTADVLKINKNKKLIVAYVPSATEFNFYLEFGKGVEKVIKSSGNEYFMKAPQKDSDYKTHSLMLKKIIEEGKVNVILTHYHSQNAEKAIIPYLIKAAEKGIVVIDINSDKISSPYPLYAAIGVRQRNATKKLGKTAVKSFKNTAVKVGIIRGEPGYISDERVGGFLDGIKGSNLKVVENVNGHWNTESGYKITLDMLKKNPDIKVIFGACDYSILGASSALTALNKNDVKLYGYDGEPDAIEKIVEGKIEATILVNPYEMGETAGKMVLDIFSGKFKGGYVETQATIIDNSNAKQFIKNKHDENIKEINILSQEIEGLAESNQTGLYWDIVREVYEPLGIKVHPTVIPFKRGITMLKKNTADAMLGLNKLDTANIIYPQWHFTSQSVVALYKKNKIPNWKGEESLKEKKVSWIRGFNYDKYLTVKLNYEEKSNRVPTMLMLNVDRIDVFLDNNYDLQKTIKISNKELKNGNFNINDYNMSELMQLKLYIGFADSPKGRKLAKIFDERIPKLIANGKLKELFKKSNYESFPF